MSSVGVCSALRLELLNLRCASARVCVFAEQLDARHVAIGVGMFNAIGAAVGGFLGPYVTGAVVQRLGSFVQATVIQGSFLVASGCLAIALGLFELRVRRRNTADKTAGNAGGSSSS
jgi:hypothetical protein